MDRRPDTSIAYLEIFLLNLPGVQLFFVFYTYAKVFSGKPFAIGEGRTNYQHKNNDWIVCTYRLAMKNLAPPQSNM